MMILFVCSVWCQPNTANFLSALYNDSVGVYMYYDQNIKDYKMDTIELQYSVRQPIVISDQNSKLLGYFNGHQIRNADGTLSENGDSLGWNNSLKITFEYIKNVRNINEGLGAFNHSVLLPTKSDSIFLLFHLNSVIVEDVDNFLLPYMLEAGENEFQFYANSLLKTEIRLNKNGKLSIQRNKKNQVIVEDFLKVYDLNCVQHANGEDWWVVTTCQATDEAYSVRVSDTAIVSTIKYQTSWANTKFINLGYGTSRFSPSGDKLVKLNYRWNPDLPQILEVMDFDRCTGTTSNLNVHSFPLPKEYGVNMSVEFSASSRYLYMGDYKRLMRMDLYKDKYFENLDTIFSLKDSIPGNYIFNLNEQDHFDFLNLTPNGKIVANSRWVTPYVHIINEPDAPDIKDIKYQSRAYKVLSNVNSNKKILIDEMNRRNQYKSPYLHCVVTTDEQPKYNKNKIYPNPTRDIIYLDLYNTNNNGIIKLIHLSTGMIISKHIDSDNSINVSDLKCGLYGMQFDNGDFLKFIKSN